MRNFSFIICLLIGPLGAQAGEITVLLYDYSGIQQEAMAQVQQYAGGILRQAGIEVRWRNCPLPTPGVPASPVCGKHVDDYADFQVSLLTSRMSRKIATGPEQFGLAVLSREDRFPTNAHVFSSRVVEFARAKMVPWTQLLGSVIAHEVGHLLLGSNSHSGTGIMRAQWQPGELREALITGSLSFTARQAEQMRSDVRRRSEQPRDMPRCGGPASK